MELVSILNEPYPVELSWKSLSAYRRLVKLYDLKDFESKQKAYCYSCFIAGRHTYGGNFEMMFSDFCACCMLDDSIVDSIGDLIGNTDTTACNLSVFWFENHSVN